nr:MAG: hypothetical protein AM325_13545 [Candidatus Thorarchaeota archaeon SMTZ1-45]
MEKLIMINKLMEISAEHLNERKKDALFIARMELAAQGQFPRFLLISPITRSGQDLQLLSMNQGDALHATRVPGFAILPPDLTPALFTGPASFYSRFPSKKGVIVTFDIDESLEVIRETLENIKLHPELQSMPIIAFQVNYDNLRVKLIVHGKGRDYEYENRILHWVRKPDPLDDSLLVVICSDSRVRPPCTKRGVPMAIQTLAGYISKYSQHDDETKQLNRFFEKWLTSSKDTKRILIVAHGNFEGSGPSCSAGTESLNPRATSSKSLRLMIEELERSAIEFESIPASSPEDRVKSLSKATRANLLTYPAIVDSHDISQLEIDEVLMDTVTNALYLYD